MDENTRAILSKLDDLERKYRETEAARKTVTELRELQVSTLNQRIAQLEDQNATLLEALKPFAAMGEVIRPTSDNGAPVYGYNNTELTRDDFERARALLAQLDTKDKVE
jgi:hypothetical protein